MRTRRLLILVAILCLSLSVIVGCQPAAEKPLVFCDDGKQVSDLSECVKSSADEGAGQQNQIVAEPVVEQNQKKVLPQPIADLFAKSSKVKVIKYTYLWTGNAYQDNVYVASRDRLKISLITKSRFTENERYDTVYIDLSSRTAQAYCEDEKMGVCVDKNKVFQVDYDDYYARTPFEWIDVVEDGSIVQNAGAKVDDRETEKISFTSGNSRGTMYVDKYYGLPLEIDFDGTKYQYKNVAINYNKADELFHQEVVD